MTIDDSKRDNTKCSFCKHIFTDQQEGDPFYGLACPYCSFAACGNCWNKKAEWNFCPKCGKKW